MGPVRWERLRAELGPLRDVRRLGSSPRSRVWQAEVSGTRVVIKQLVPGPEATDRYAREVTALRLAGEVAPTLLGTDPDELAVVLAYVEDRPAPADWAIEYADALARLHSVDVPADKLPAWTGPTPSDVESFLRLARTLDCAVPTGVPAELDGLLTRLAALPRTSLLHGDPCPDNTRYTSDGVRFIDFEQAAAGAGVVELAYLRIGFPTCWCAMAAPPEAAEHTYRAIAGDQGDLTDACAGWLLRGDALVPRADRGTADHLDAVATQDWRWGTATARERLAHRLAVVGAMTTPGGALAEFGALTVAMRKAIGHRWPTLAPLPVSRPATPRPT